MSADPTLARLLAEMEQADAELRAFSASLAAADGLLDPGLNDIFARLSRRPTRAIGDNNANGAEPRRPQGPGEPVSRKAL
jgi:hypothetical protein